VRRPQFSALLLVCLAAATLPGQQLLNLSAADRVAGWREDLDVVRRQFLEQDRSFDAGEKAAAQHRLDRLKAAVALRTDQQVLVELSRIVALSRNAHTRLYFIRNRTEVRRVPIRVWWFHDELRVVRADVEHSGLLGCRVIRVGDMSVTKAFDRVRDIKAGNSSWQRYMSVYYLTSPDVLAGAGVIDNPERLAVTTHCNGAERRVALPTPPLRRSTAAVEAWWDLAPAHPGAEPLRAALDLERTPLYLRRADENYWFDYIPDSDVLYFQYNRAEETATNPMRPFGQRLVAAIKARPPRALIVDVRFNTGGNLEIATPLVKALAPVVAAKPVFVLTSRATFSAGITHAAQWKQVGGTIVGEPVADDLDMWSEGGNVVLPRSGLTVHFTNGFHRYSLKEYPANRPYYFQLNVASLDPAIRVEPTWSDYVAGRDPVLDAVLRRLARMD
jgi:hypothetical protein